MSDILNSQSTYNGIPVEKNGVLFSLLQGTADCNFFTHHSSDRSCFAFENCPTFDETSCQDCISGEGACAALICDGQEMCDFLFGNEVDRSDQDTKELCAQRCMDNEECGWYSYDRSSKLCLLTRNCGGTYSCIGTGCTHSQKSCGYL